MASNGEERAFQVPSLTALPRIEELPRVADGYDVDRVNDAFEAFRRHAAQIQAQLRVLQAAGRSAAVEPTGHAVRMDALHLIRAAAEFADTIERDAQTASAAQVARTEEEVRQKQIELQERETEIERYRAESERQRAEIVNTSKKEAREIMAKANLDASQEVREAEARGARLLEQARHQATELTNAARAEVEQTLEWSRAQATLAMARAQNGAEQLLRAAGLGEQAITEVAEVIMAAAQAAVEGKPAPHPALADEPAPPEPKSEPEPAPEPVAEAEEPEPAASPEPEQDEDEGSPGPAD